MVRSYRVILLIKDYKIIVFITLAIIRATREKQVIK